VIGVLGVIVTSVARKLGVQVLFVLVGAGWRRFRPRSAGRLLWWDGTTSPGSHGTSSWKLRIGESGARLLRMKCKVSRVLLEHLDLCADLHVAKRLMALKQCLREALWRALGIQGSRSFRRRSRVKALLVRRRLVICLGKL